MNLSISSQYDEDLNQIINLKEKNLYYLKLDRELQVLFLEILLNKTEKTKVSLDDDFGIHLPLINPFFEDKKISLDKTFKNILNNKNTQNLVESMLFSNKLNLSYDDLELQDKILFNILVENDDKSKLDFIFLGSKKIEKDLFIKIDNHFNKLKSLTGKTYVLVTFNNKIPDKSKQIKIFKKILINEI